MHFKQYNYDNRILSVNNFQTFEACFASSRDSQCSVMNYLHFGDIIFPKLLAKLKY